MARNRIKVSDLGAMIESVGTAALDAQKKAVFNAAMHMKKQIEIEREKDLPKGYFTRMHYKILKSGREVESGTQMLTIGFNVKGSQNPTALLVARGPWGLLEYGAKEKYYIRPRVNVRQRQRQIKEKFGGSSRAMIDARRLAIKKMNASLAFGGAGAYSGVKPLSTPYGPRYGAQISHGVKGKKTFSRGYEKGLPEATRIATSLIQSRVIRELRNQFGSGNGSIYVTGVEGTFEKAVG